MIELSFMLNGICKNTNGFSTGIIFSFVQNCLSHSVDIFCTFSLSLTNVNITNDFLPACSNIEFGVFFSIFCFFFDIVGSSVIFFLFFFGSVVLELFASFLLSFLFFFPFFLLDKISNTLLSASNV